MHPRNPARSADATPKVQLPSGRSVRLTKTADPRRPWEISSVDGVHVLTRMRRGDSTALEYYAADRLHPLTLDRADAEVLVAALNGHAPKRAPPP